jgi:hypothetical protein
MPKNKTESIDVLKLKLRLLTIAVILLIGWQIIDLLRVNTIDSRVDNKASEWDVETLQDDIKRIDGNLQDIREDIYDIENDMWEYAKKTEVNNQIGDIYDYIRSYV